MQIAQFRKLVRDHAKKEGRHTLPWRNRTVTPYGILVSEIMLQQTQVDRVIPFYRSFLRRFPTARALSEASLSDVLHAWQGLGYNRRAKMLHEAAKAVVHNHGGKLPRSVEALEKLPGIGPYTARAVAAFAYNEDVVFVETNLRTAVIHHFFPDTGPSIYGRAANGGAGKKLHNKRKQEIDMTPSIYGRAVNDKEILEILEKAFPRGRAREWYSALMDYGAALKRSGIRTNTRSVGYVRQSAFKGSAREVRGAILRALLKGAETEAALLKLFLGERKQQVIEALTALKQEGMVEKRGNRYQLSA